MTIRNKTKVFAELNYEETVLVPADLVQLKYVVSAGDRNVKTLDAGPKKLMITNSYGDADHFYYGFANMMVGINASGKLEMMPRLLSSPPPNKELILDIEGFASPQNSVINTSILLPGYTWYEIEVIGAGGGGGGGRTVNDLFDVVSFFDGKPGGSGGYYKGTFQLNDAKMAYIHLGNGGGGGKGYVFQYDLATGNIIGQGTNAGGEGGRQLLLSMSGSPNDGLDPVYSEDNSHPTERLGGIGINTGPDGGKTEMDRGIAGEGGIGASGGGGNGPYGGKGGDSIYKNNVGLSKCFTGGGGGAGGGLGQAGRGGGSPKAISYGAGSGGKGATNSETGASHYSAGGGGGGGASRFICDEIVIIAGGGGGGAGAGYGGTNLSTPGGDGEVYGGNSSTSFNNGGAGGQGERSPIPFPTNYYHNCTGQNGGAGRVRIWRLY